MKKHGVGFCLVLVIQLNLVINEVKCEEMSQGSLNDIFQYELNNRAFALESISRLAKDAIDEDQSAFWTAYLTLEE